MVPHKRGRSLRSITRCGAFLAIALLAFLGIHRAIAKVYHVSLPPMPLAYAFTPSPNWDERPGPGTVTCIVLHATVEPTMEGTIAIFLDPLKRVSSHFIVGKDGRIVQMVPVERRAWHAGNSVLEGVGRVNDFSVGIEMVNRNDGVDPYPQPQLEAVAGLIRFLRSRYDIPDSRIVSHAQIALPPGRKSDPVGFDFDRVRALARIGAPELPANPPAAPQPPANEDAKPSSKP